MRSQRAQWRRKASPPMSPADACHIGAGFLGRAWKALRRDLPPDVRDCLAETLLAMRLHLWPTASTKVAEQVSRSKYDVRLLAGFLTSLAVREQGSTKSDPGPPLPTPRHSVHSQVSLSGRTTQAPSVPLRPGDPSQCAQLPCPTHTSRSQQPHVAGLDTTAQVTQPSNTNSSNLPEPLLNPSKPNPAGLSQWTQLQLLALLPHTSQSQQPPTVGWDTAGQVTQPHNPNPAVCTAPSEPLLMLLKRLLLMCHW